MVSKLPLPLVHGTGDAEVSPLNSEFLVAAAGELKELRSPSNMGHTSGVRDLEDEYSKIVIGLPRASGRLIQGQVREWTLRQKLNLGGNRNSRGHSPHSYRPA